MTTAGGGLAGACQGWLAIAACLYLVGGAVVTWVDLDVHRVPDRVLAAWVPVLFGSLVLAAVTTGDRMILGGAAMGAVALGGLFLVLALVGSMGLGDVTLAAVTGLPLGAMGRSFLTTAVFACFAAAAVAGVWLLIRGISRRAHLAFGPAIVVGGAAAVIRFGLR
nr:prepilin peptidase [Actinopolymorpha pittospori]